MPSSEFFDYEPVTRPKRSEVLDSQPSLEPKTVRVDSDSQPSSGADRLWRDRGKSTPAIQSVSSDRSQQIQKRGHAVSFAGLFLFTFLVYFRPYELFPSLIWLSKSAFWVAVVTLAVFVPTQLALENRLTIRTREVNAVLLLALIGLLSVPMALEPPRAWGAFLEYLKVVVMFIVMVNVVRTQSRLNVLMILVLLVSCVLGAGAINDYRIGNFALEGKRIAGLLGGMFANPNDMALHLVTIIPLSIVLLLSTRSIIKRFLFLGVAIVLLSSVVVTFSRGGFLGLVAVILWLGWKLARRHRLILVFGGLALVFLILGLAPGAYRSRILTTEDASAVVRTDDLKRSVWIAMRHPLLGVGMDNYILYSNSNKTTHNAYTQVAAEMGLPALAVYILLLLTTLKSLSVIEKSFISTVPRPRLYYLSVGLQASVIGYMVTSFFASVAFLWYLYYLIGYSVCLTRFLAPAEGMAEPKPRGLISESR